jgi:hypothetical protein
VIAYNPVCTTHNQKQVRTFEQGIHATTAGGNADEQYATRHNHTVIEREVSYMWVQSPSQMV